MDVSSCNSRGARETRKWASIEEEIDLSSGPHNAEVIDAGARSRHGVRLVASTGENHRVPQKLVAVSELGDDWVCTKRTKQIQSETMGSLACFPPHTCVHLTVGFGSNTRY